MNDPSVTIRIPYTELLLGLERLCKVKNAFFPTDYGPHSAAQAIPLILSTLRLGGADSESCDQYVAIGSIGQECDPNGNLILRVSLEPKNGDRNMTPFLASVAKLQETLAALP